jgi:hypothetical protein
MNLVLLVRRFSSALRRRRSVIEPAPSCRDHHLPDAYVGRDDADALRGLLVVDPATFLASSST